MINFSGTSEQDWMNTSSSRIKDIIKRLNNYNKEHKKQCPFLGKKGK